MTDIRARLHEAADHLDCLFEGSKHIPTDLIHDQDFRVGLVRTQQQEVAQFHFGGAAEVFMTLGPAALPILTAWLRAEAVSNAGDEDHRLCSVTECTASAALAFADHVLTTCRRWVNVV